MKAVTKDGQPRFRTECDRGGTKWSSREVLVPKNTDWMDQIALDTIQVCVFNISLGVIHRLMSHYRNNNIIIFQCVESRNVPDVELPGLENIPVNQSKVPKPEKTLLIAKQQTRLKMNKK